MQDKIQKLYELAGIKLENQCCNNICGDNKYPYTVWCNECKYLNKNYPPFTDRKQFELIKWIEQILDFIDVLQFVYRPDDNVWYLYAFVVEEFAGISTTPYTGIHKDFPQALAGLVCELWEDLSDEQREEIKEILK